jgi:hypothetical protein
MLSPARKYPESERSNEEEEPDPLLNQFGATNPIFDPIVGPPSGKNQSIASVSSASLFSASEATARDDEVLEKQAKREKQLRQLFSPVISLGSEVRSVIDLVRANESKRVNDATESDPSQKGKGKAASCNVSFANLIEDDMVVQDDADDDNDDDDDNEIGEVDDYVSHLFYRERLAEGLTKCLRRD